MSMDRRQFVKLTGVGASGALATNAAAGEQSTLGPTAETFEFVGVSEEVRLVVNSDDPTNPDRGITLSGVEPPLDVEGTAPGDGTWNSAPTTVTETELIEGLRNFNEQNDVDLGTLLEDILDDTPEELVATLLENLSVESLLANSNGDELFRIIADIIDALDLDAGQGEDIINAIDNGTEIIPEVPIIDVPSILEILENDPAFDSFIATIAGFGLGGGNADKLLAGDVDRQTRANLLQTVIERVDDVIDSLPDLITDALDISIPDIPTLNDATDLVAFGDWLLQTITELQNTSLGGGSASVQQLEARLSDDPDQAEVMQALADLEAQQTVSADGGTDTQQEEMVGTQQQQDPSLIDRLLATNSVTELDNEIDTIAQEIRNQGFDAVFGSGDGSNQDQDTLKILLDLLEQQLTLDVNIGQISGDYNPDTGVMTAPVGESNVSVDGSFQNGLISFIQDLLDQLGSGDDGGNQDPGLIDVVLDAINLDDFQPLIDELLDELQAQNLIDLPTLQAGLTTGTSGSFDGSFAIEDGPAGGSVQFVENEFTIGYDKLITDIENIDVATALGNVEVTDSEFNLKTDVIDNVPDSAWNDISTKLGESLKGFASDGAPLKNNPVAYLENNISGVSDFPTFLNDTAASAGTNIETEVLLTDIATATDVDGVVTLVTNLAPNAFTDSAGRHAVEAAFTIVGKPGELPGGITPQDNDGDGRFETFRGSEVDILDTQELFNALKNGSAQQTPRAFNFSQSSAEDEVSILDVAAHWKTHVAEE